MKKRMKKITKSKQKHLAKTYKKHKKHLAKTYKKHKKHLAKTYRKKYLKKTYKKHKFFLQKGGMVANPPDAPEDCSICYEPMTDSPDSPTRTTPCGHQFHEECLQEWLSRGSYTCPVCRGPVDGEAYLARWRPGYFVFVEDLYLGSGFSQQKIAALAASSQQLAEKWADLSEAERTAWNASALERLIAYMREKGSSP
jgi:hypothetical protein